MVVLGVGGVQVEEEDGEEDEDEGMLVVVTNLSFIPSRGNLPNKQPILSRKKYNQRQYQTKVVLKISILFFYFSQGWAGWNGGRECDLFRSVADWADWADWASCCLDSGYMREEDLCVVHDAKLGTLRAFIDLLVVVVSSRLQARASRRLDNPSPSFVKRDTI